MRLSYALLLAFGTILLNSGNALISSTDLNKMVNSKTRWRAVHYSAESQSVGGRSIRTPEDEDVNTNQAEEERGYFGSKLPPGVDKATANAIKLNWLKNSALYDEMLTDTQKYYQALATWKDMGYSAGKVKSAMKKLGKNSDHITYIKNGYKAFLRSKVEAH
ncbi:hypothetical protein JG688_00004676 [Phytophthora aleatoria]|uniref:RxLR effector protein n=1 Tax=Phytophthora aleatoria TaxID=2496075 RepID=A0A8J5MH54_9STRA|nr:hypothetical protein JG688_00004676 [Phytophthora aleatoria]